MLAAIAGEAAIAPKASAARNNHWGPTNRPERRLGISITSVAFRQAAAQLDLFGIGPL
jgi:hypothetical protein